MGYGCYDALRSCIFVGIVAVSCIRNHVKEDQAVLRQAGSVRYGAAGSTTSRLLRTVLLHVWERLKGIHHQGWYDPVPGLRCDVVPVLLRICRRWRFGLVEEFRRFYAWLCSAVLSHPLFASAWFRRVAAGCSFHHPVSAAKEAIVSTMGVLANVAE